MVFVCGSFAFLLPMWTLFPGESHTLTAAPPKNELGRIDRHACLEGSKPNVGENMRGPNACVFQFRFECVVVHTHGYVQGPILFGVCS